MGMKYEHPTLAELYGRGIPFGEISEVTADTITITGDFPPGDAVTLRPGTRVYVLTADDAIELVYP